MVMVVLLITGKQRHIVLSLADPEMRSVAAIVNCESIQGTINEGQIILRHGVDRRSFRTAVRKQGEPWPALLPVASVVVEIPIIVRIWFECGAPATPD
jgi:hypothetical protein